MNIRPRYSQNVSLQPQKLQIQKIQKIYFIYLFGKILTIWEIWEYSIKIWEIREWWAPCL